MAGEIIKIQQEVELELSNKQTLQTLVATTFKGLSETNVKQAMVEGMLRGFAFKDCLEKNVYAISYGSTYNLVTSIDYARKIGMRSGVVGKSAPKFEEDQRGTPVSCTITIQRKLPHSDTIGDFTATVYMAEYSTGRNLWATKPRTMLAKVAEMHALRMACPEELSQSYVEEEMQREAKDGQAVRPIVDLKACSEKLKQTKSLDELKAVWAALPAEAKADPNIIDLKDGLKKQYEGSNV
jgi:hypothetical protein